MWSVRGWYVVGMWLVCGWYMIGMWSVSGRYVVSTWSVFGWYVVGKGGRYVVGTTDHWGWEAGSPVSISGWTHWVCVCQDSARSGSSMWTLPAEATNLPQGEILAKLLFPWRVSNVANTSPTEHIQHVQELWDKTQGSDNFPNNSVFASKVTCPLRFVQGHTLQFGFASVPEWCKLRLSDYWVMWVLPSRTQHSNLNQTFPTLLVPSICALIISNVDKTHHYPAHCGQNQ